MVNILSKINKNKKSKNDLTILLHVKRSDGVESTLTYGRRSMTADGNDYFFKIKNPFGSGWFEIQDIPSENISINRVINIFTNDLINFYIIKEFDLSSNDKKLSVDIVKVDNRVWFKKAMIRKQKRAQKGWLDEHKTILLVFLITAFAGLILYLLISNLGGSIIDLTNVLDGVSMPVPLAN